ncbi:hypothetical protein RHGRI_010379 [Rhododendron griersonianum]|uniref:F-box domain-containing protein n=1 Tax=Rhododendron griersonianum TaxID=479676 RepID=A0AAV6KIC3_9ERIC|nr:hypothetical protein RHGRI_010379 [Rhododendron griersonianum]
MRKKKCTRGISSGNTGEMVNDVYLPHEIVIDILTRLPARVVGQCKSICKHWRALIEDPTFAELHHNRAKCRPDSCYLVISFSPAINFDKIDFFSVGYEGGSAQRLFTFPIQEKVIHWRSTSTKPSSTIDKEVIVAFDLKDERFHVISLPEGPSAKPCLRELGGRLAACEDFPEDVPEELWILEDYENWVWVKVIIMPPCDFVIADGFHTNGAIQTGEILLRSPPMSPYCLLTTLFDIYYYNRKKSSIRRIDIAGLPLSEFMGPRALLLHFILVRLSVKLSAEV